MEQKFKNFLFCRKGAASENSKVSKKKKVTLSTPMSNPESQVSNATNRNYCFTLYPGEDWGGSEDTADQFVRELFIPALSASPLFKFAVFQLERCPETGRLHLQGYLELTGPRRFTFIKDNWSYFDDAHFEKRRGNRKQAIDYCEKEESRVRGPWRIGNDSGQGSRSDLAEVAEKIQAAVPFRSIVEQHPSTCIRYIRGIERVDQLLRPRRKIDWDMEVIVFWGDPGAGKTEKAKRTWPEAYRFMQQRGQTPWWNGYDGEETILIDEFANNFSYHYGLSLLGEPGMRVEVKGGDTTLYAKRIVITSMDSPTEWWPNVVKHRKALYRRITHCYHMQGFWPNSWTETDRKPIELDPELGPWEPLPPADEIPPQSPIVWEIFDSADASPSGLLIENSPLFSFEYGSTQPFEDDWDHM